MGAIEMGVPEEELQPLVASWRRANPKIVSLWWDVDRAVRISVCKHERTRVGDIRFRWRNDALNIKLPSGRVLSYVQPHMGQNHFGRDTIYYYGLNGQKKWSVIESYGPKFVENIVQAISRDILAYSMRTLKDYRICAHVHDELIIECPESTTVEEIAEKMGQTPPWAEGLYLRADGYECSDGFYLKS